MLRRIPLLSFLLCFGFSTLTAQDAAVWLRHPAISPDGKTIAFTHRGNLFTVPVEGGEARQLTFHEAHDYKAVWSPDGQTLAFASDRYGNFDVFTMPARGGLATRLTFHSNGELPTAWTPDGSGVVFTALRQDAASHRQFPHGSQTELYRVPKQGGRVTQVLTVPAEAVAYADAKSFYYQDKKGGEDEFRKHHRSSIARDIWHYDAASGKHTQLTTNAAEDRDPTPGQTKDELYFLSERGGTFNVWMGDPRNLGAAKQITRFKTHPVRFLSRGYGTLCFGYDGQLYTLKDGGKPRRVPVTIVSQDIGNTDKFVSIRGGVSEMAISPSGKEIAFIARGEVFVTSVGESFTKRLTNTPEPERFVTWGPEGKSVVYGSERDGKWSTYKTEKVREEEPFFYAATLLRESPVLENEHDNYLVKYSPDGKRMAWVEDRRSIKVADLDGGNEVTLLDEEDLFHMRDGDKYFTWSPDSKWLLVDWSVLLNNSEVLLMAADGSKRVNLTESGYYDSSPVWVNGGKQMLWFSNRDGLKSYATSGRSESDVYSMFFTRAAWDKFRMSKEDFALTKAIEEANKEKKKADAKEKEGKEKEDKDEAKAKKDSVKLLEFDWEGLEDRTARLTIHSSRLGDAVLSKDGETLYYLATFEKGANLWSTNLRTRETKMVMKIGRGGSLQWDKDHKNLYLLAGGTISKLDVGKGSKKPISIKAEMAHDADAERRAMFDHIWTRTNAIFYEPSFHGVDWDQMRTEYEKYLPGIGNGYEFAEMASEMLGELNVSHAGARYRSRGAVTNPDQTASLGILLDYAHAGPGIRIAEILPGGPLDKAAYAIEEGAVITAIDGETITADRDVASYLNRKAGNFTLLAYRNPGATEDATITVKPTSLGTERRLLYTRWVKRNEKEVEELSNGQLGYVHIPGMSDGPYRDIYQEMLGKYRDRKGVIIDTRFNGGGDLVADLAMFFTGRPFITYATEAKVVGGEPTSRWTKPTLSLIGEAQYSDGHCFSHGYKDLGIGKTVGMPTPGTCSFAGWERLPDGTVWGVVPVSAKDIDGDWMENNATVPDVIVKNLPGDIAEGKDAQLERAVKELLNEVKGR